MGQALQVQARELTVANSMTQLWLELGYQPVSESVMRENQLLVRLENYVQTNYSIGKSEAQDNNAQLQVSKLDEKLQANQQVQHGDLSVVLNGWALIGWFSQARGWGVLHATN